MTGIIAVESTCCVFATTACLFSWLPSFLMERVSTLRAIATPLAAVELNDSLDEVGLGIDADSLWLASDELLSTSVKILVSRPPM